MLSLPTRPFRFLACALAATLPLCFTACRSPEKSTMETSALARSSNQTPRAAIVQLFNWPFIQIERELQNLRDIGVTHIHVSPAQQSIGSMEWWGRYQPDDFRTIVGPLGGEAEFAHMIQVARSFGIEIIADVVLNHMANYELPPDALYYPRFPERCDPTLPATFGDTRSCLFRPEHFHPPECIQDYSDHCAVLRGRICGPSPDPGLPDLRTGNCIEPPHPYVVEVAKAYIQKLINLGVRGLRIDAAKHMSPTFLSQIIANLPSQGIWIYGEIIADNVSAFGPYNIQGLGFMDFPLASNLKSAFAYGGNFAELANAPNTGRTLPADRSIMFVTNHDVWGNASGLGYRYEGEVAFEDEILAHIFILGRGQGIPYIYSEGPVGPSRNYRPKHQSYENFHNHPVIRNMLNFNYRTQGKTINWLKADQSHLAFERGEDAMLLINKTATPWGINQDVATRLRDGVYMDFLSPNPQASRIQVTGGRFSLVVRQRSASALVRME